VEVKGNVDMALARLAHALDMWHCDQPHLVVSDEGRAKRVRKLVEPRVAGAFAKLKSRLEMLG